MRNQNNPQISTGGLTAEQKARISHNFRAAKALLARKRPRNDAASPDHLLPSRVKDGNRGETPSGFSSIKRVALKEIPVNEPSPFSGYKSKMEYEQQSGGLCSVSLAANRNVGVFVEKEFGLDSFRTPLKPTCSKSSESFSIPSVLDVDDDLDESILEEIDALCEQKSTRKVEKTPPSCISFVGNGNAFCEQKSAVKIEKSPPSCISFVGNGVALCEQKSAVNIEKTPPSCISFVENDNALCEQKSVVKIEKTPPSCNSFVGYGNALCELKSAVKAEKPSPSSNSLEGIVEETILEQIDALYEQKSVVKAEKPSPSSNSLVENVEESILEEIVALCEQKSAVKAEKPSLISNSLVGNCGNLNTSLKPSFDCEGVESKASLDLGQDVEIKEGLVNSQSVKIGSMPEEFSKYMLSLNDRQREAACTDISTPLMIVAGPGSGKTSTMVGRVLMLLHEGISPLNILAMTFTTAAASEMRDRIGTVAGKAIAKELTISTFHSFSLQLCRLHAEKLGRTTEFLIYGHGQQRRAVIEAVRLVENEKSNKKLDSHTCGGEPNGITSPEYYKDTAKKWLKFVTRAKASGKTPEECRKMGDEMGAAIIGHYNDILKACNALDYHDLISCSVKLLNEYPEVRKECQDSWRAIVIDEFQDTSAMQYSFLQILASHNRITIVGDDDQSIFGFNGADVSGFDSFRKDFSNYKEVRLNKNYRSTRYIVEAASSVIKNNKKRCQLKNVDTDNSSGSKIIIKECHNEDAQCAFVIDKIFETAAIGSATKGLYGNIAILYRRQVSGKVFQVAFRERKIPFNIHGVAFYRKKVVRAILAMLRTTLPGCDDGSYRRVFKAFLPFDKEEKKRVIEHIDKIATVRKCSFVSAACDIFSAKISGTFKRSQITQGRKVLSTLEMISKLVHREQSISAVISSVANMVPEKYLLEQRAVVDVDGGKLLNEDNDIRSVLQYLLDDVSNFISTKFVNEEGENEILGQKGCLSVLKAFIDHISDRERENFRFRKEENKNSVTLTTIHQSKGLEWDMVFIVKANESEIPLLHEFNGAAKENGSSLEEERRLFYVAMTRARRKLFILYVSMDSNYQIVQPSRFLKEIPEHLREVQGDLTSHVQAKHHDCLKDTGQVPIDLQRSMQSSKTDTAPNDMPCNNVNEGQIECMEYMEAGNGNSFIKRFSVDERSIVSHIFHQWAKKKAFQDPKRLLDKVGFVIDERLRVKNNKHKVDVLRMLKSCLKCDEAFQFAEYVLRWETIPAEKRAHLTREKQEHFQKLRIEKSMGSSEPTAKQKSYLQNLGCTVVPTSRLHASHLIEQYKSL